MTREEALEVASRFDRVPQCSYFMTFLGYPPEDALYACGLGAYLDYYNDQNFQNSS